NVESDCVPTRSALMTGRHPIRTGALQSMPPGAPQGISPWEVTLAELIRGAGYETSMFGKWHLGDRQGRFPNDRGFDEWYGIPRTTDEVLYNSGIGYDEQAAGIPQIMDGVAGSPARDVAPYDDKARRMIDADLMRRGKDFLERKSAPGNPFFLFMPIVNLHFPTLPHPDFEGKSGYGGNADCMMEMDHRVGEILDKIDELALRDNTLVIFCSDNGPEFRNPWRGTAGPWRGTYHTAMEGSLRVPCILRWPGRVEPGVTSNEIVHVSDLFTTLCAVAGADLPSDRPIDGIDQSPFLFGGEPRSLREGFPFYIKNDLRAVKWRDWKLHFYWEPEVNEGKGKLESPYLFNLTIDPKEEHDIATTNSWVWGPIFRLVEEFTTSMNEHPNTEPGAEEPPDAAQG
ncbi:MAG: sulfatase-like hydrolase/transferase, partial [Rhodobacteraceae bacterium]|nr:sulfatase-like hydrolase/transferase [Paracoccaceae bacterium]